MAQVADSWGAEWFNSDNGEDNFDNGSDNKGPEPEGIAFVDRQRSPTGNPLVLVAHEVSGTVTILEFE